MGELIRWFLVLLACAGTGVAAVRSARLHELERRAAMVLESMSRR
jgi:hypothetical protein